MDSDADGVVGKIGEGGVAIDTVEDMERLYANFRSGTNIFRLDDHQRPCAILLAMLVAAASAAFGSRVVAKLRAQCRRHPQGVRRKRTFFRSTLAAVLTDMVEFTTQQCRVVSDLDQRLSIAEAGATPVQQAASRSRTASPTWNCSARAVWT